jgi:hypothetical protein
MKNRVKPPSVWITQILILLLLLPFLYGFISPVFRCLINFPGGCLSGMLLLRWVIVLCGTITISFFTLRGLQKGKRYGQWLGITLLIVVTAILFNSPSSRAAYSYILSAGKVRQELPPEYYNYSNNLEMIVGASFTVLTHLGLITLVLRLAFAKAARHYFSGHKAVVSESVNNSAV